MPTPSALTPEKAYAYATRRCAAKEHAACEMAKKLAEKGFDTEVVAEVVERLVAERYIDDARFAHAFVQDKYRFNRWGQYRIERELRLRGVAAPLIAKALAEIDWDVYLANLERTLTAKLRTLRPPIDYKQRQKLMAAGVARGYHSDDVREVMQRLLAEMGDEVDYDEPDDAW